MRHPMTNAHEKAFELAFRDIDSISPEYALRDYLRAFLADPEVVDAIGSALDTSGTIEAAIAAILKQAGA